MRIRNCLRVGLLVMGLVLLPVMARAGGGAYQGGLVSPPSAFAGLSTNQVLIATNAATIPLQPGAPLVLNPSFTGTSQNSNVVFGLNLYNKSANVWTTSFPILMTNAVYGSTNVVGSLVVPASSLQGYSAARWDYYSVLSTNGTTAVGLGWSQYY